MSEEHFRWHKRAAEQRRRYLEDTKSYMTTGETDPFRRMGDISARLKSTQMELERLSSKAKTVSPPRSTLSFWGFLLCWTRYGLACCAAWLFPMPSASKKDSAPSGDLRLNLFGKRSS